MLRATREERQRQEREEGADLRLLSEEEGEDVRDLQVRRQEVVGAEVRVDHHASEAKYCQG